MMLGDVGSVDEKTLQEEEDDKDKEKKYGVKKQFVQYVCRISGIALYRTSDVEYN